jgi:uncharacterized protein (DUF2249 family)
MSRGDTPVIDVRPILAAGGEPLSGILAVAEALAEGGELVVIAPFDPVPLFGLMRQMGFSHASEPEPGGAVRVVFTRNRLS